MIADSIEPDFQNAGESCGVGEPINMTNGNMWLRQSDYSLPGVGENLKINRFYNSIIQQAGIFGFGWKSDYDESISNFNNQYLTLMSATGRGFYFSNIGNNVFASASAGFYGQVIKNTDNTFTLTYKDGRIHQFNSAGRLLWQKDRNGNQTTLTYNASNQLTAVTDPFGRVLTLTPNAAGYIGQISDSIGVVATYAYNPNGTLLSVTYPDNSKYKFEYTTIGNKTLLTTVKDAYDNILEKHDYDSQGRATTSEKQGGVEKFTLDYFNLTATAGYTQVTDALSRVTKYYVDKSRGRNVVTKVEGNCNCGSGAQVTNYQYDSKLNLTKETDALGYETTYIYDTNGNRLTMTDVLGTETYTYNSFGQTLTSKDRMNGLTTNTFDPQGNLLTTQNPLNFTTTFTYTPLGQLITATDGRNNVTTLAYDTLGRLSTVKDADNKITTYGYDARARITSVKNALTETTTYGYDLNNRINRITYPDTKFISYGYDLAGRRTTMTDALGKITTYGYDPAYRLTTMTDPLNHTTTFGYDLMSNRTSVKDALNQTTNYEFDDFNRLKKIIYPPADAGGARLEESIEYDAVGNVKKRIDTALRNTLYDYDNANRLQKITDADSKLTQFEYNVRSQMTKVTDALVQVYDFTYDPLGRVLSQTRAGSTMTYEYDPVGNRMKRIDYMDRPTTYEYDKLNRLKKINYLPPGTGGSITPPPPVLQAVYNYDALSRLTSAVNEAGTVSFSYDTRGRTETTTDVYGKVLTYGYDDNSNRNLLKLDGTNYASYGYDDANRLTNLTNSADNAVINFGYDNANKLTSRSYPNSVTTTYNYDGMSRLTRLRDSGTSVNLDRQYSYNTANQINSITEPAQTRSFGYDNLDRLTAVTPSSGTSENYAFDAVGNRTSSQRSASYTYQPYNRLTGTATGGYEYDSNGNMEYKYENGVKWQYVWDYENRLTVAKSEIAQVISYTYDALGRRVARNDEAQGITKFTYDGQDVILDENSDGTIVKYLNGQGIDNKLLQTTGSTAEYFLTDHLGSTNALVNSSGAITSQTAYDAFGNQTATLNTRYGYTGRERDDSTGLMYYRARQYSTEIGRFINEDPIGFAGGDLNLFVYVRNNSLRYTDPNGKNYIDAVWNWFNSGKKCGETAIKCKYESNQRDSDKKYSGGYPGMGNTIRQAKNMGSGKPTSSMQGTYDFFEFFGKNENCQEFIEDSGDVFESTHPLSLPQTKLRGKQEDAPEQFGKWIMDWFSKNF